MASCTNSTANEFSMDDLSCFYRSNTIPTIVGTALQFFFYGIYVVLFSLWIFVLHQRKQKEHKLLVMVAPALMFMAATVTTVLDVLATLRESWLDLGELLRTVGNHTEMRQQTLLDIICGTIIFTLYVLSNLIADLILIYRCSVVWGSYKPVVIPPLAISLLNNGLAIAAIAYQASNVEVNKPRLAPVSFNKYTYGDTIILTFLIVNVITNVFLTCLVAARIWWLGQRTKRILGQHPWNRRNGTVVAMILESGIIYPVALITSLVVQTYDQNSPTLYPFLIQIVGIAPTLIIVRAGLGLSVEDSSSSSGSNTAQQSSRILPVIGTITNFFSSVAEDESRDSNEANAPYTLDILSQQTSTHSDPNNSGEDMQQVKRRENGMNIYVHTIVKHTVDNDSNNI